MTTETLTTILTKHLGAKKDGNALVLSGAAETTLFVSLEGETLQVPRVERIELTDGMLVCTTQRGSRVVVACEDVRALKTETETAARERSTGFGT